MDDTPSDQQVPNVEVPLDRPNKTKKSQLLLITAIILLLLVISLAVLYLLKSSTLNVQNSNNQKITPKETLTDIPKSNPQIQILATHPPANPDVLYNMLFDPQSTYAVYSTVKFPYTASSSAAITINGNVGSQYKGIDQITISPDGRRVAYVATQDDMMFVVVDGKEGKKYESIHNLKFSPDSQHIVYAAGEGIHFEADSAFSGDDVAEHMFIVVDDTEHQKYEGTYSGQNVIIRQYDPYLSQDNKLTYTAIKDNKDIIVLENTELSEYESQSHPQFIGDTNEILYLASENNRYFLVVAGKKQKEYNYISDIIAPYFIGKNESQIAFEVSDDTNRSIILNGTSHPILSGVLQNVVFSSSGQNVAYYIGAYGSFLDLYINKEFFYTVQRGQKTKVTDPVFSPNEQFLAYAEYNESEKQGTLHIISINPNKEIKRQSLPGFTIIGPLKFSEDGKNIYFKGFKERDIVLVTFDLDRLIK